MTHSGRWCCCLLVGTSLIASAAIAEEPTSDLAQVQGVAESILAREEAASERAFDPIFRTKAKELLATLPLAELVAQTGDDGLGLNSLGDTQADLLYTPLTPCRIIDTRRAGGAIGAGTTRSFLVTGTDYSAQGGSASSCGVPFGPTTAAVINLVAVDAVGRGNLSITPFGKAIPLASIINFTTGFNVANGPAIAVCDPSATTCTKDITIQANVSAVHLVADVQGYYRRTPAVFVNTSLSNTALGDGTLASNTTGTENTATGRSALQQSTTAADNSAFGYAALAATTTGGNNSAFGAYALANNMAAGNSAFGAKALYANTTGDSNSAFGEEALTTNTSGYGNSAFGYRALRLSTPGWENSAFGAAALSADTTGGGNSAFGYVALGSNTTGSGNSAFGDLALYWNSTGGGSSAFGYRALYANTTGGGSSAFGYQALYANTTGVNDSAFGYQALSANTTGGLNSAFGYQALSANTTGADNSAFGCLALHANTAGQQNSAFGRAALFANTTGGFNSAFGIESLSSNTLGTFNAAFGHRALRSSTGSYNAAFGQLALWQLTGGDNNIAVGYSAGFSISSGSYNIYVGNNGMSESNTIRVGTVGTQTATYIAGISGATVTGSAVYVNSNGQLGLTTSSRRYKEQIADMSAESDVLTKLRPVSFYYRPELDESHLRQYGLVAEEVAEVAPGLVDYDKDGQPQAVRYHFVNAMLLNEVQKQRRQLEAQNGELQEQRALVQQLREQLARLEARLAQ